MPSWCQQLPLKKPPLAAKKRTFDQGYHRFIYSDDSAVQPGTTTIATNMDLPLSGLASIVLLDYAWACRFATMAARAFARFATSAAFRAGDIFFFAGAVFVAGFSAL
jgi:hypothetical protein